MTPTHLHYIKNYIIKEVFLPLSSIVIGNLKNSTYIYYPYLILFLSPGGYTY